MAFFHQRDSGMGQRPAPIRPPLWSIRAMQSSPAVGIMCPTFLRHYESKRALGFGDGLAQGLLIKPEGVALADWRTTRYSNQKRAQLRHPRPGNPKGGTTSFQLRQYAEATLGGGSLRKIVKLPEGEDENEWLAVNSEYCRGFTVMALRWMLTRDRTFFQLFSFVC